MDVDIRVDIDEDGPVVVKSALGRAVGRLRHEHHRLSRAVHPGVVPWPAVSPTPHHMTRPHPMTLPRPTTPRPAMLATPPRSTTPTRMSCTSAMRVNR